MSERTAPDHPWSFLISTSDLRKVIEAAVAEDRKQHWRTGRPDPFTKQHGITETEWKVLVANAEYPNQEKAAAALGINPQTFKNHMTTAKRRLQASSQHDIYLRLGWLVLPDSADEPPDHPIPDELTIRGHFFVHVAACRCREPNSHQEV